MATSVLVGESAPNTAASIQDGSFLFIPLPKNITRAFLSYGETKCPQIRTHYHFQIVFSADNRDVQNRFDSAQGEAFGLGDDIISLDAPDQEFVISIPDKPQNKESIHFLQSEEQLSLGDIHFTTMNADESPTFCGTPGYDSHDTHAASEVLVEIKNLPLHLWTFKTVDYMLHPYCVVADVHPTITTYDDLLAFRCICWTDTPTNVPSIMHIKIKRKNRGTPAVSRAIHIDMFTVLIRVVNNPLNKKLHSIELLPPLPTARPSASIDSTPHCFLQNTEVDPGRFQQLMHSMLLKQRDGDNPIGRGELFSAIIQHVPAARYVNVQPISFDTFLVHYQGDVELAMFTEFRSTVVTRGHIQLAGHVLTVIPWSPSYGSQQLSLSRFVRITISDLPIGLLHFEIASQLLSPFLLLEGEDVPNQGLIDADKYACLGWIDSTIDVPDYITIYITPRRCQSDYLYTGHHYMPLYTRRVKIKVEPPNMLLN